MKKSLTLLTILPIAGFTSASSMPPDQTIETAAAPLLKAVNQPDAVKEEETKKPNILYILADDLGYADISANGWDELEFTTPNIDTIFNGGARFKTAFVANSVCAPSRAGLMTGRSGSRFGFEANIPHRYASLPGSTLGLDSSQDTLADVLKTVGYKTFCIGKWHLGDNDALFHPNVRGFDEFVGQIGGARNYFQITEQNHYASVQSNSVFLTEAPDMHITDFLTDQALDYITDQTTSRPDQPWFMFMSYTAPHGPMDATRETMNRARLADHYDDHSAQPLPKGYEYSVMELDGSVVDYRTTDNNELRQVYASMTISLDDNVGRLLRKLDELGITENTLIVFHSDNGGPTLQLRKSGHVVGGVNWSNNSPLRGRKGELWDGGIRVPFAISWQGTIASGQVFDFDLPVSSLDLMPTFAAISGADQLQEIRTDGVNLMPLLTKGTSAHPDRNLYWRRGTMRKKAIRSKTHKYFNRNKKEHLYDHSDGVGEWQGPWFDKFGKEEYSTVQAQLIADWATYEATLPDAHWNPSGALLSITTYDLNDAKAGATYSMPLTCSVPKGASDPVWSILSGKPGWLDIDPVTGELSGTPAETDLRDNALTLQIETDGNTSTYQVPLTVQGGAE